MASHGRGAAKWSPGAKVAEVGQNDPTVVKKYVKIIISHPFGDDWGMVWKNPEHFSHSLVRCS